MRRRFILFLGFMLLSVLNQKAVAQNDSIVLNWLSFEEMQIKQSEKPKKVLVDIYANWCVWCKALDVETYGQQDIAAYLNKNYYLVKFNPEDDKLVEFKGSSYSIKTYKYSNSDKKRRVNSLAVELMNQDFIYPSIIFMNEKLDVITVFKGFKNQKDIDPILSFFATDSYLKHKWSDYLKTYKSILK